MKRRALIALAAAVIASQALLWWLRPEAVPPADAGPPRSGYSLTDFTLEVLTASGSIGFRLAAPRLQRRDADASLFIDAPRFHIPMAHGEDWHGRSEHGWVSADGNVLKLFGDVTMAQADATRIHTRDLTAWPAEKRAASAAPVEIRQPGRILTGTGMKADLATHTLELLADVHGTLEPASR